MKGKFEDIVEGRTDTTSVAFVVRVWNLPQGGGGGQAYEREIALLFLING